jgi:hypothetical protein
MTPYQRGYRDGYLAPVYERAGRDPYLWARGVALGPEEEADYYLGFGHGRHHARTGRPADGAAERGEIPPALAGGWKPEDEGEGDPENN